MLATWMANIVSDVRIIGLGVLGVGVLVVGMRFIFSSMFGSEHQNVIAKSGIIALIAGGIIVIASTTVLTILYGIAGVTGP
jgi:hypothetical protein